MINCLGACFGTIGAHFSSGSVPTEDEASLTRNAQARFHAASASRTLTRFDRPSRFRCRVDLLTLQAGGQARLGRARHPVRCAPVACSCVERAALTLRSAGKFYKSVDPGLVKVNPFSESLRAVDVKIQVIPIPRQTALTKDNVNVQVDSVIYWHVTAPYKAAFGIADVRAALVERAQTTLRSVIGSRTLQNVVVERESIALEIEEILEAVSSVPLALRPMPADLGLRQRTLGYSSRVDPAQGSHLLRCVVAVCTAQIEPDTVVYRSRAPGKPLVGRPAKAARRSQGYRCKSRGRSKPFIEDFSRY